MTPDAAVLVRIRRLSVDGLAPSTYAHQSLYKTAVKRFGNWGAACRLAGVRPRSWTRGGQREATPQIRELAKALHVAQELGIVDVSACINYVRRG